MALACGESAPAFAPFSAPDVVALRRLVEVSEWFNEPWFFTALAMLPFTCWSCACDAWFQLVDLPAFDSEPAPLVGMRNAEWAAPFAAPLRPWAELTDGSVCPLTEGMREAPLMPGEKEWLGATRID